MFRAPIASLLLLAGLVGACKKADPTPVVGDLELTLNYPTTYKGLGFNLYTEAGWAGPNQTGPLRQFGMGSGTSTTAGRLQSGATLRDLNPGNYVITLSGILPKSVQVIAGRTNSFTLDF